MKKWMTFFLAFVLCLTVVEVHAKEHLSEKDVRMFKLGNEYGYIAIYY